MPGALCVLIYGEGGFDRSRLELKIPIPAIDGGPGLVTAGGDISPSELGQPGGGLLPEFTLAKVASINQDIAGISQGLSDDRQLIGILPIHGLQSETAGAQPKFRLVAMRNEMNGIDIGAVSKNFGHLFNAVPSGIQQDGFRTRINPIEQNLIFRDRGIDKDNFSPIGRG